MNGGNILGKLLKGGSDDAIRLYRGLEKEFDPHFSTSNTDAPVGYSTFTDNAELAKQYAGKNGFVYSYDLPKKNLTEDIIDADGERGLFFDNQKPAGLNGVSGKEYLVYNDHELYDPANMRLYRPEDNSGSVLGNLLGGVPEQAVKQAAPKFSARFGSSTGDATIDSRIKSVVNMSPDDYLKQAFDATDGRLGGSYDSWLNSNAQDINTTRSYAEAMKRGDEFPMAYIDNAFGSQDGRNRALAVKMAGGDQMPVGLIPDMTDQEALAYYTDRLAASQSKYSSMTYQKKIDSINDRLRM